MSVRWESVCRGEDVCVQIECRNVCVCVFVCLCVQALSSPFGPCIAERCFVRLYICRACLPKDGSSGYAV